MAGQQQPTHCTVLLDATPAQCRGIGLGMGMGLSARPTACRCFNLFLAPRRERPGWRREGYVRYELCKARAIRREFFTRGRGGGEVARELFLAWTTVITSVRAGMGFHVFLR